MHNNGQDKCSTAMKVNCALSKCNGSNTKTFGGNLFMSLIITKHFFGFSTILIPSNANLTLTFTNQE